MINVQAILFDWGNTLVHVRREGQAWAACAQAAVDVVTGAGSQLPKTACSDLKKTFMSARVDQQADPDCKELDFDALFETWLARLHVNGIELTIRKQAIHAFWDAWTNCLDLLDDSGQVLSRLKRHHVLGLVSNVTAPRRYCESQLQRLGLLDVFHGLTFSSEIGVRKPRPEIYEHAMRQLQEGYSIRNQDVLFVGDSPLCDVEGPRRLGMQTALMIHPDLESYWPKHEIVSARPDFRVERLGELEGLLDAFDAR